MLCCAIFSQDHRWYRALVKEVEESKKVSRSRYLSAKTVSRIYSVLISMQAYNFFAFHMIFW